MWFVFALLSSVFAALTSILAKVGIDGVNSNLATAIRTAVVLVMGHGVPDTYTVRNQRDREEKLVVPDFIRTCNRSIVVVLL